MRVATTTHNIAWKTVFNDAKANDDAKEAFHKFRLLCDTRTPTNTIICLPHALKTVMIWAVYVDICAYGDMNEHTFPDCSLRRFRLLL